MSGKMLNEIRMPATNQPIYGTFNREFERERQYGREQQKTTYDTLMITVKKAAEEYCSSMHTVKRTKRS